MLTRICTATVLATLCAGGPALVYHPGATSEIDAADNRQIKDA